MDAGKRVCVAHLVGMVTGMQSTSIFDFDRSILVAFLNQKSGHIYQFFDISRRSLVYGSLSAMYDSQTGSFFNIVINGNSFSGLDMATSMMFSGTISGALVSIYDTNESRFFLYGLR